MSEKPQLALSTWSKGGTICYKCSVCNQSFILPEDVTPTQGIAEVFAAFEEHVREVHFERGNSVTGSHARSVA